MSKDKLRCIKHFKSFSNICFESGSTQSNRYKEGARCCVKSKTEGNKNKEGKTSVSYCKALLLLLLSRFSHIQLCATPETAAHQAPQSLGFSRQEHWSGLPFPSPVHESESESEVAQSCPTLSDLTDCSPPDFSIHGIFQARVLEWGAIAFSKTCFLAILFLCGG